jgi:hypothetical protein
VANCPTLYVKSEKVYTTQYSSLFRNHDFWTLIHDIPVGASKTRQTAKNYKTQDKEAMDLLEKLGIPFNLVDLSNCSLMFKLKAKIIRINETPTLVLSNRKIKGIQNIKEALHEIKVSSCMKSSSTH